jgi:hypothetical protein
MALKKIHLAYLRRFLDELILNQGIVRIENPEQIVEKVKMDYLLKLAIRFYSKLYNSEKYASYIKESEIDYAIDPQKEYQPVLSNILFRLNPELDATVSCLNCGIDITPNELKSIGTDLPLCPTCFKNIGIEFEIWQKVLE